MVAERGGSIAGSVRAGNLDALQPGEHVGRYEIVSLLGQGGFGITYRAKDAQLDREVAIKEYLPSLLAVRRGTTELVPRSEETAEDFRWGLGKFIDEGRTLARLGRAPAIVRVHDFLECHGTAYLVMELLQGETLEHRLHRSGTLDVKAVNGLFWPLLDGLARVHATGFLHRDIKPANILVDADGCPTLIDFGASRAAVIGHSAAMTAIFTPGYAAIEQYTSSSQGPWTDIYGLSATVHHAIVGHPPPPAVARILEDAYRPLVALRPAGFDQSFLAGIDAGLSIRASQRPQSIDRWRELLQTRPSDQETADTVHLGRLSRLRRPDRSRAQSRSPPRLLLGALAAIGLAVLGTLAYVAFVPQRMSPSAALEGLQVQELEQVLIQRRKAAAEAAAKQQAEEEAQREAAAEAQRQADEAARRKAAAEAAAKQRAEEEAKRQAAAEAQRQADEATKRKAAAEAAAKQQAEEEAKRQAAAEARRQADEAARRKAAAEAAAKQQAEEEAKRQAAAEAQRQADEAARRKAAAEVAAKQQAEEEAKRQAAVEAQRQADEAARRKAAAEAAAKQQAEEEAQRQAAAEAQRQADEAARRKAAAEVAAKQQTEEEAKRLAETDAKRAAEAGEAALRLSQKDRQHVQVALTSLGFDTRGADGIFGPRSREMIAAWQRARLLPATGYLAGSQHQVLLKEAAAAVSRYDEEQKRNDEQKKAEEEAKARAIATTPQSFDGPWRKDRTARCAVASDDVSFNGLTVRDGKFSYTSVGRHHEETCQVQINADGSFRNFNCLLQVEGRFTGDLLQLNYLSPSYGACAVTARRGQ